MGKHTNSYTNINVYAPVPDGVYNIKVAEIDEEYKSKTSGKEMVMVTFEIIDGAYQGRRRSIFSGNSKEWKMFLAALGYDIDLDDKDWSGEITFDPEEDGGGWLGKEFEAEYELYTDPKMKDKDTDEPRQNNRMLSCTKV